MKAYGFTVRALRRSRLVLALAGLMLVAWPSWAQKVGTTSMQFLKVMPVARATALGDAFVALAEGVESVFWNPSGLALAEGFQITGTHIPYLIDTRISSAAIAFPLGDLNRIGIQVQYVDYGEIVETRTDLLGFNPDGTYNPGLTGNTFSPQAWAVGLSYGRSLNDQFLIGITAKYVHESLYDGPTTFTDPETGGAYATSTSVVLFDFGLQYDTGYRTLRLGAAVQNFGPEVVFVEENFAAPMIFRLGAAWDLVGPSALLFNTSGQRFTMVFDMVHPNDYDQQAHVGVEYVFADVLALRAGRKINYDTEKWTLGGGLHIGLGAADLSFDYSYNDMGEDLGAAHRITLSARLK